MIDPFSIEEEFHKENRKESKKEKKLASHLDRSKYKKTDLDKLPKQKQIILKDLEKGTVISIAGESINVFSNNHTYFLSLKGALKKERTRDRNIVAVGDIVYFSKDSQNQGSIVSIEERKSILIRKETREKKKHIMAVNVDQVLITSSVVIPYIKINLIDRYIISAKKGNLKPIIIINKIDLLEKNNQEAQEEAKKLDEIKKIYPSIDIPVIEISIKNNIGIDKLKQIMENKTSVFSGQSGVGKTSIINSICDKNFKIGPVVKKTYKGAHVTTTAQLMPLLEENGFCIDTPGIKSFGIWDIKKEEIIDYFPDIQKYAKACKYADCQHINETECGVKKALEENKISSLRFESYISLINDITTNKKR